ncbi:uncharacterized protein LOC111113267 isoform X1 [Crassostrea virginica]
MGDPEVASSSTGDNQREKDILAIRLLRAIREKKVFEAKKILEEKPNILFKDKDGCQCLHFAAQEGVLDLVKLLLEEGAHVNCFDHNGQSPLHKAASRGHLDVVIHLVASGAQVGSLDWANHTPFEKAVISRSVEVVEVLLTFGAEPNLQDWTWAMGNLGEKEKKIQDLITQHVPLVPGYKYEGIQFEVVCVKTNEDQVLKKLNLTVKAIDVRSSFIFFCRKMQSEYTTLKSLLKDDQTAYSDMFEIRTWGVTRKTLAFALTIEGVPKLNEHLHVVSPNGSIGRVDNHVKNEDENTTEVTLTLKMNTRGPTQFAIVSVFKKETFAISTDEAKIVPASEPDAEIDIPKGAFEKAAELQLNVVDTQDVNEDEEDESGPLLMTNVIDMSMSDGQQPKEEIVMKLPIHNKGGVEEEMCVLATSEEDPDDEDDWEIIEAERDAKGKAAVFRIKHFSIYAGANKKKVLEDKKAITEAISRSMRKERKVEFKIYTRLDQDRGKFQFILECWAPKKLRKGGKSKFETDGCEAVAAPSDPFIVEENQTFKLSFKGNCKKLTSERKTKEKDDEDEEKDTNDENDNEENDEEDFAVLDYNGKKGYTYTIIDMIVLDTEKPNGKVFIEKEMRKIEEISQAVTDTGGLCKGKEKEIIVQKTSLYYEDLVEVGFGIKLPPPPKPFREPTNIQIESLKEEKKLTEFLDKVDAEFPSFVPGLDMKNLSSIALQLDTEEAKLFGKNLGLQNDVIEEFMKTPLGAVFMIRQYRGKRPHYSQKISIRRALEVIDRHDLVHLIMPPEEEKMNKAKADDKAENDMPKTTTNDDNIEEEHTEEETQKTSNDDVLEKEELEDNPDKSKTMNTEKDVTEETVHSGDDVPNE